MTDLGSRCNDSKSVLEKEIETRALMDYFNLFGGAVCDKIPAVVSKEISLYLEASNLQGIYGVLLSTLMEMHKKMLAQ